MGQNSDKTEGGTSRASIPAIIGRLRWHKWSIREQLLVYGLALLLPITVFSGLMIYRTAELERSTIVRETQDVALSLTASIDRSLSSTITTLKALATSPSLTRRDFSSFYRQARAANQVGGDHFVLTDTRGNQLVNTRFGWGDALPATVGDDWSNVLKSGQAQISNLQAAGDPGSAYFSLSVPVFNKEKISYVLSASIEPTRILEILEDANLDEGWTATVVDRSGTIIARFPEYQEYVGKRLAQKIWLGLQQRRGVWSTENLDGVPVLRASTHSRFSDWLVGTTVPAAVASQSLKQSWVMIASLAAGFCLLSVLFAYLFGHMISGPVRKLASAAEALGRGNRVPEISSSIREVDEAAKALSQASRTRARMEHSLRESDDRLRLVLRSAATGAWDWNLLTNELTWDSRMRELWGLGPEDTVTFDVFVESLHPDDREKVEGAIAQSQDPADPIEYDVEYRVTGKRNQRQRWIAARGRTYFGGGKPVRMAGTARDVTQRKRDEEHIHLLMREITHRSKNLLAVIQAMARQTKAGSKTAAEFEERFSGRLQALAASHDLLVQQDWTGVSMSDLVHSQLAHYLDQHATQISISGPHMIVTPEAAQNIGLAVHELSTNAAKYGALSVPKGRIAVKWSSPANCRDEMRVKMTWKESGGPKVTRPSHRGFGQLVMEQLAPRGLDGDATLDFDSDGVCWVLDMPAQHVLVWDANEQQNARGASHSDGGAGQH